MNTFEAMVKQYLEGKGYWVRGSVKVKLSGDEKKAIGLPSMPRPEIDLVAFNVRENKLVLVEVKSLLDSGGVDIDSIKGEDKKLAERYRIFNKPNYRKIVTNALKKQFIELGLIQKNTDITYALAAGKIYSSEEPEIEKYFKQKGWLFISPKMIRESIHKLAKESWEDDPVAMTAKLILREGRHK
jgi:hypothetical protein